MNVQQSMKVNCYCLQTGISFIYKEGRIGSGGYLASQQGMHICTHTDICNNVPGGREGGGEVEEGRV